MITDYIGYLEVIVPVLAILACFLLYWEKSERLRIFIASLLVGIIALLVMLVLEMIYITALVK